MRGYSMSQIDFRHLLFWAPWRNLPSQPQSVSKEEPEVQEAIPPGIDLRLPDPRPVWNTNLSSFLLPKVSPCPNFELLGERHSIMLRADPLIFED